MRRILLTVVGATALALTAPAAALAGEHHHRHHHHHRRDGGAHVSFRHLGPPPAGPNTTPSSGSMPTVPTTPTTSEENAGKVTSYTGGVLTITLADGSTVSGKVTVNTRFRCIGATATPPPPQGDQDDESGQGDEPGQSDDNGQGDDRNGGDRNEQGGQPWQGSQQGPPTGGQWQQGNDDQNGSDDGDDDEAPVSNEPPCDSSALVENAVVRAAELRIAPGGAEFEWITLVR